MTSSLDVLEAASDGFNAMFKPGDTLHVRGGKRHDDPKAPTGPEAVPCHRLVWPEAGRKDRGA
jgi:hypothetical protein